MSDSGKVKNLKHTKSRKNTIYIGRGSKYGNPYRSGRDGTRNEVIQLFEIHLNKLLDDGIITVVELSDMYGLDLLCYCKPQPCHGDVLLRYINSCHSIIND